MDGPVSRLKRGRVHREDRALFRPINAYILDLWSARERRRIGKIIFPASFHGFIGELKRYRSAFVQVSAILW